MHVRQHVNESAATGSPLADIMESLNRAPKLDGGRAKRLIQESEQRFASFMNHLPGFAWIKDAEGRYVFANKHSESLPKYANCDYVGKTDFELWPPDIAKEYRANDKQVRESGLALQKIEAILVNGERHTAISNKFPIFDAHGKVAFVGGVAFDITEHLRIEQELKDSHAQLRALTAKLQSAREEEARRIGREIHDELGQALAALNMDCAFLEKAAGKVHSPTARNELLGRIESMARVLEKTIASVQRICSELRPTVLDDLGLVAALECYTAEFQARTRIRCTWLTKSDAMEIAPAVGTDVFRIFQEILTNVMRHAVASEVTIKLESKPDLLRLEVCDNGRGISEADISNPKSLGLLGMRERAFLMRGVLEIARRHEGTGTIVSLAVPLRAVKRHET